MKHLPKDIAAALDKGVSGLCHCWHIVRRDGQALGLTDHDTPLSFDNLDFEANAGMQFSALEQRLGLASHGPEARGVLSSPSLAAADLRNGLYDHADFRLFLVDWQMPENHLLLMAGQFGPVRVEGDGFAVTLRGQGQQLNAITGRVYQPACDADLGDKNCRVNINASPNRRRADIVSVHGNSLVIAIGNEPDGWFRGGTLHTPDGVYLPIRDDTRRDGKRMIGFWQKLSPQIKSGQQVTLTAGCDKRFETCCTKFDNAINFHGFPTLATEAVLLSVKGGA
jgi:uncharacterized phage protein (TIGR02218 family)